jgi:hypothetical protein
LANTSGGFHATNNQRGAGVQFYTDAAAFTITYTKRPDGGIMEIWVNGRLCTACGEVNTWSGNSMTSLQAVHFVNSGALTPTFGAPPYFVQLVNSGRQTPATTSRPYITIDNIRFPAGGSLLLPGSPLAFQEAETGYTGQDVLSVSPSQFLPMNGVWSNMAQSSAFGGRFFNTTTPGAEFRFEVTPAVVGPNANDVVVYYTGLSTGALLEIYVDGQLCTACGTIDTYRATTMYRIPYFFTLPSIDTHRITLRNTGRRSSGSTSSTTATMAIDRLESFSNTFTPLDLYNVQADDSGGFWINERWVANRQTDAIGADVYINNSPYGGIFFPTCSRDFTLLLGKSPNGGMVRVRLWDDRDPVEANRHYLTLAEFNGQAASTTWRNGLNVAIPPGVFDVPSCPYANGDSEDKPFQILVEVDSNTQFGSARDYAYVDALLINDDLDGGSLYSWSYTAIETLESPNTELAEIGTGWATFTQTGALGGAVQRTNQTSGRSVQFTLNDDLSTPSESPRPRLIFSRAPDGGIAEVFVNGIFQYEISFYSPTVLPQQFLPITLPADVKYPAVVELRNVPRRTSGSTNYYMYVDAIHETDESGESGGFVAPIINNGFGAQNDDNTRIQLFGATWTRSSNPPTTTIFPSGSPANIDTTTATSGGLRFRLTGSNRFTFVSSVSANRGIAEIWVNGRRCTACGTINTFRPQTFWQVPFLVEIPDSFDADPPDDLYFVEIRTTNMRSTGATGFGLSGDEIIPLDGGAIDWNAAYTISEPPGSRQGTWSLVSSAFALDGSFFRTTRGAPTQVYEFYAGNGVTDVIILRNTLVAGGIAEFWISDWDPTIPPSGGYDFLPCSECGTMNNYSSYTRYQVPFFLQIPSRFDPIPGQGNIVQIRNLNFRPVGSTGFNLEIDGFMFP